MFINRITIDNFRNYARQEVFPGRGVNMFIGKNAQGKSNFLEALYVLGLGRSYRTSREEDVLPPDAGFCRIAGDFTAAEDFTLEVIWEKGEEGLKKTIRYNSNPMQRLADFIDKAPMVLMTPDDLELLRGSPSVRRKYLDLVCGRIRPAYISTLREYRRVLESRNLWLKRPSKLRDKTLGEVYTDKLCTLGGKILQTRLQTIEILRNIFKNLYNAVFQSEAPEIRYRSSVKQIVDKEEESLRNSFRKTLQRASHVEERRKFTPAGPHRDDIDLKLKGVSMKNFSSLGEIRSAAVILKLTEVEVISRESSKEPVVLVDDCLNEFDREHIDMFFSYLVGRRQFFYTGTMVPEYLETVENVTPHLVSKGKITPCALSRLKAV